MTDQEQDNGTQSRFIDKVLKLLAKMESTTPEEAEALAAKVEELMTRHAIDEAMLASARGEQAPDTIIERRIPFTGIYASSHYELAAAIGNAHGFKVLIMKIKQSSVNAYWIGFESEIKVAEMLLTSLLVQAESAQREFMKDWNKQYGSWASAFEKATARRSFLNGFANGVGSKMRDARKAAEAAATASYAAAESEPTTEESTGTSVALVLASRKQRIDDWVDKTYGTLKSVRTRATRSDYGASAAGREAGRRANLGGKGVSGSKGALPKG